jgi:hypothetical protein
MSGVVGQGDLTFGTLAAEFEAEAGFSIDGKKVPAVKCTPASATNEQYAAGNISDWGQLSGTIIVDTTSLQADFDTLIGTTAALSYTYQGGGTLSGTAIFLEGPHTTSANDIVRGAAVFQWTDAPSYTDKV